MRHSKPNEPLTRADRRSPARLQHSIESANRHPSHAASRLCEHVYFATRSHTRPDGTTLNSRKTIEPLLRIMSVTESPLSARRKCQQPMPTMRKGEESVYICRAAAASATQTDRYPGRSAGEGNGCNAHGTERTTFSCGGDCW